MIERPISYYSNLEFNLLFGKYKDYINFIDYINDNVEFETLHINSDIRKNYYATTFYITGTNLPTDNIVWMIGAQSKTNIILDKLVIVREAFDDGREEKYYIGEDDIISEYKKNELNTGINSLRTAMDEFSELIPEKYKNDYDKILLSMDVVSSKMIADNKRV